MAPRAGVDVDGRRRRLATNGQPGPHYGDFGGQPAPALYNWFPTCDPAPSPGMNQAAWSVVGNSTYVALGGEFPAVNGVPQQGLVRFAVPSKAPKSRADAVAVSSSLPTARR